MQDVELIFHLNGLCLNILNIDFIRSSTSARFFADSFMYLVTGGNGAKRDQFNFSREPLPGRDVLVHGHANTTGNRKLVALYPRDYFDAHLKRGRPGRDRGRFAITLRVTAAKRKQPQNN